MRRFTECLILSAVLAACDSATDPAGPALTGADQTATPSLAVFPEHFTARTSFDSLRVRRPLSQGDL
jgi:hypothetical protein